MKIKYFVRGLGMGILVTAIILGVSYKSDVSDEDIILRAKNLGMVFPEDISSETVSPSALQTRIPKEEVIAAPTEESDTATDKENPATQEPNPTKKPDATKKPKATPVTEGDKATASDGQSSDMVDFSIERGDWSRIVSEKLESLGVVDSAKEFDKYLVDNGYAIKIKVGSFSVKKGADYSEIAKMITD